MGQLDSIKRILRRPFGGTWGRVTFRRLAPDLIAIISSLYVSLFLRLGTTELFDFLPILHKYLIIFVTVRIGILIALGTYNVIWRYISAADAFRLFRAILLSSVVIVAISYFLPEFGRLPRSFFFIDTLFVSMLLMGIRLLWRLYWESKGNVHSSPATQLRTLIYGAGNNGRTLAQRFRSDSDLGVHLEGFIDDDVQKYNGVVGGFPVLGTRGDLRSILRDRDIKQLIVAIPNMSGELLRETVQICRAFDIRPRIIGRLSETSENRGSHLNIYREVELRDLLNRPSRQIDLTGVGKLLSGKIVLVAGAGGSIGSELARQVMRFGARRVLLLDHSEYNLYQIDHELRLADDNLERVTPLLTDIKDDLSLRAVMKRYRPEVILHAAAYKHVHLAEINPYSVILNNILGTRNLLQISEEIGVETFVLISTDKAVNPAGVMGATKRVCELMVTAAAKRLGLRYCSVRFGNVMGSSGSLIPKIQQQIRDGGPVTVTHPEMTRYFMLIPEAVSLVLNAAVVSQSGEISVLKMGDPIRIVELVKSLITLMAKTEDEVPIIYTGIRPGEKLFEELYLRGDEIQSEHPDILILPDGEAAATTDHNSRHHILKSVDRLIELARAEDAQAIDLLNELIKIGVDLNGKSVGLVAPLLSQSSH